MPTLKDNGTWSHLWRGIGFELGAGGQGTAHEVEHKETGELGVLKHMKPEFLADPIARARMFRESGILSRFEFRSGVPRLLDTNCERYKEENVPLYFVMKFVPGITLDKYFAMRGRLLADEAVLIVKQLVETTAWLHGLDPPIYHRDIKPKNIIVTRKDTPVLIDFGIAYSERPEIDIADKGIENLSDGRNIGNKFCQLDLEPKAPAESESEASIESKSGESGSELPGEIRQRDADLDITCCCGILLYLLTGEEPNKLKGAMLAHERKSVAKALEWLGESDRKRFNALFGRAFQPASKDRFRSAWELHDELETLYEQLEQVTPQTLLSRSPLSQYMPEQPSIFDRLNMGQEGLREGLYRLTQVAKIPDEEVEGMRFSDALKSVQGLMHADGKLFIEPAIYAQIEQLIRKIEKPGIGDDDYLLTFYTPVNRYLSERLNEHTEISVHQAEER
jgi:serine/threonine protein kinase